jgi:hypothetical protein
MNVAKVAVLDQLPLGQAPWTVRVRALTSCLEIEGAPRDQRGFMREAGEVQVRFGVKLGHLFIVTAAEEPHQLERNRKQDR